MIISRSPFRISFFGGGTDYPSYFREHPGAVLATTIDRYCYITCRYLPPFFEHRSRVLYSKIELVASNDEIQHPAVRASLQYLGITQGVEIHHDADLPARAGIGSSSTFCVGLLNALYAMKSRMVTREQLARDAIAVEQDLLKENVGCQDQVLSAFGGLNRVDFLPNGTFTVTPVILPKERLSGLNDHLMLFFTGFTRNATDIAAEQIANTGRNKAALARMYAMVDEGTRILAGHADLAAFGELLHEAWEHKRGLSSRVTTTVIDEVYTEARAAGAVGGKLLGAGGGGFMMIFAPPEKQAAVKERLKGLLRVPFNLETAGSQIILYQPDATPE